MPQIIREVSIDVSRSNIFQAIVAKQNDSNSRFLKATITDNGKKITVESSSIVTINGTRPDEEAKAFEGTVNDDGTVTVPLTNWLLELDGRVKCDISIVDADGRKLTTMKFTLLVEAASYDGSDISEDEDADLLISILAECASAKEAAEKSSTFSQEVEDIRVGYDGTTYTTAGEAVRAQVQGVKGDVEKIAKDVEKLKDSIETKSVAVQEAVSTVAEVGEIRSSTKVTADGSISASNHDIIRTYFYYDIADYDAVTIRLYSDNRFAIAFFDAENNFISSFVDGLPSSSAWVTLENIPIPDNASYVCFTMSSGHSTGATVTMMRNAVYEDVIKVGLKNLDDDVMEEINTCIKADFVNKKAIRLPQFMNWAYQTAGAELGQMAVDGRYLYYTSLTNIYKVDVGCEVAPEVILDVGFASNIVPKSTTGLVVNGDYIYVGTRLFAAAYPTEEEIANKTAGALIVLNKSDLSTVSVTPLGKKVSRLILHGNLLIVNLQMLGWAIYDVSNPAVPTLLAEVDFTNNTSNEVQGGEVFEADGKTYYVAAGFGDGIRMYDITDFVSYVADPSSFDAVPVISETAGEGNFLWYYHFYSHDIGGNHTFDVTVKFPYVYATIAAFASEKDNEDRIQGILTLDVSNITACPASHNLSIIDVPDKNDMTSGGDTKPSIICRMGNAIIVNNDKKGIAIFDATYHPEQPEYEGIYTPYSGCSIYRMIAVEDGRLFIADGSGGSRRLYLVRGLTNRNI